MYPIENTAESYVSPVEKCAALVKTAWNPQIFTDNLYFRKGWSCWPFMTQIPIFSLRKIQLTNAADKHS